VPERRGDQPLSSFLSDTAAPATRPDDVAFGPVQRVFDGAVVGVAHLAGDVRLTESEEHGHGLRGAEGQIEAGIQTALRLLALDPLQEAVHRALIELYAEQGRFGAAVQQYQSCRTTLERELGIAPAGAYLAVSGEWPEPWWSLPALALAVTLWVAGFDIIYALQDEAFDREHGLRSIPVKLGASRSLRVARVLHIGSALTFLGLALFDAFPVGVGYLLGVAVMAALLIYEHAVVRGAADGGLDLRRIDRAFFRANVAVSTSLLLFTFVDRVLFAALS